MEINTYLFVFSLIIISLGVISFIAISQEMKDETDKKVYTGEEEGGPRAKLFDAMYELFSDEDEWPEEIRNAKKSEIRKIVQQMNEARSDN